MTGIKVFIDRSAAKVQKVYRLHLPDLHSDRAGQLIAKAIIGCGNQPVLLTKTKRKDFICVNRARVCKLKASKIHFAKFALRM